MIKTIIVEDESRIRRGIERLVRSCGEEWDILGTFSDGQEAFDTMMTSQISIDLVITDVKMPEMDGLTLVKELKKSHSFFALFISGFDDFQYLQSALREGAINYILKPIDRDQFRIQMEEIKEKVFQKKKEQLELEEIQEKAQQLTYTKQVQQLSEITWNADTDLSMLGWAQQFPKGRYKLLYFSVDQILSKTRGFQSDEWEVWNFAIENILEELVNQDIKELRNWWWRSSKLSFWLLFLEQEETISSEFSIVTEEFAIKLKNSIQRFTPFTVSVAVGREFQDITLIPNFRDQLLSLIQFRMIQGGNNIFNLDSIKNVSKEEPKGITATVYKNTQQIIQAIESGDESKIKKELQGYFQEIENLSSPTIIEEALHYLFICIVNRWMEHDGFGEDPHIFSEAIKLTKHASSFSQLKDSVKHWVIDVKNKIQLLSGDHPDSIQLAKEWINQNLGENITVKKIANQVHLNPTYFCEYFKTHTGETVLDYVTRQRLEKAKELLKDIDLKIYDISCLVGYQDTKYFSRLFKNWMGESPSQYRDNLLKRNIFN